MTRSATRKPAIWAGVALFAVAILLGSAFVALVYSVKWKFGVALVGFFTILAFNLYSLQLGILPVFLAIPMDRLGKLGPESVITWAKLLIGVLIIAYVPQAHDAVFPYTVGDMVLMGRTVHRGLFAAPGPDDRVVDLGCGWGTFDFALADLGRGRRRCGHGGGRGRGIPEGQVGDVGRRLSLPLDSPEHLVFDLHQISGIEECVLLK